MVPISIIVLVLQILRTTYAVVDPEALSHPSEAPVNIKDNSANSVKDDNTPLLIDRSNVETSITVAAPVNSKSASNTTIIKQDTIDSSNAGIPITHKAKDNVDSGALLRGFYVFLGLSLLTIFYFLFKTYRLRSGSQPPTQVRKYGVLTRRGDVEMLPLPLDDEDEDDTVFDLGNHSMDQQHNRGVFAHS